MIDNRDKKLWGFNSCKESHSTHEIQLFFSQEFQGHSSGGPESSHTLPNPDSRVRRTRKPKLVSSYDYAYVSVLRKPAKPLYYGQVRAQVQGWVFQKLVIWGPRLSKNGTSNLYKDDEEFRVFVGMKDGLAFLPSDNVGMQILRNLVPDDADELVNEFDQTYVSGTYRPALDNSTSWLTMIVKTRLFALI